MSKRVVAAHQPNFLPYLGFFDKMKSADVFVIRDEVLFAKRDFHHRNRIRINGNDNENNPQSSWVGFPVEEHGDYLLYIKIKDANRGKRHWKQQLAHELKASYQGAPYFEKHFQNVVDMVNQSNGSLVDLNMALIGYLSKELGTESSVVMASKLGLKPEHYEKSNPSDDLVAICREVGADVYLSGAGGKGYLEMEKFSKAGIEVQFQEYKHPVYAQHFAGFLPYMSAIDALFCLGRLPDGQGDDGKSRSESA